MMQGESTERVLQASGLRKTYRSGTRDIEVLRGVDLELSAGRTLSIRGESGSGKTTLLNLLAGIETSDTGSLFWNGSPVHELSKSQLPKRRASFLGFVFQSYYLIPELNTLENVSIAARIAGKSLKESRERSLQLLEELGLQDRLKSSPQELSGGERQRTAIARALVNQPELVLADEPTGNLDEATSERVMDQFLNIVETHGTALVLVTHHPGYAGRTSEQYHLEEGLLYG